MRRALLLTFFTALTMLLTGCATTSPPPRRDDIAQLLTLQKTRLDVAAPVARSKWNSGKPIDDPARERHILDGLTDKAVALGLDPAWTRAFFQSQFDAGKLAQRALHRQWRAEQRPPFADPPDLAREVRPVLDRLTPELLTALTRLQGHLCDPEVMQAIDTLAPAILGADYPAPVRDKALETLRCQR